MDDLVDNHIFNRALLTYSPLSNLEIAVPAFTSDPILLGANDVDVPNAVFNPLRLTLGPDLRKAGDAILVSCLMVTQNRFEQAKIAVGCFRRQTWPQRELLIVDTTETDELPQWVEGLNDPRIRVIFMPGCTDKLGKLRNLSIQSAAGNYLCQWDDDDLSHPARLEVQIAGMIAANAEASFLVREMVWFPFSARLCVTGKRAHENTMLCKKLGMPSYPDLEKGEDVPVADQIRRTKRVVYFDLPELYIYTAHRMNTWHEYHMEGIWRGATQTWANEGYSTALRNLATAYPIEQCERAYRQLQPAPALDARELQIAPRQAPRVVCVLTVASSGADVIRKALTPFSDLFVVGELFDNTKNVYETCGLARALTSLVDHGTKKQDPSQSEVVEWLRSHPTQAIDLLIDAAKGRCVVIVVSNDHLNAARSEELFERDDLAPVVMMQQPLGAYQSALAFRPSPNSRAARVAEFQSLYRRWRSWHRFIVEMAAKHRRPLAELDYHEGIPWREVADRIRPLFQTLGVECGHTETIRHDKTSRKIRHVRKIANWDEFKKALSESGYETAVNSRQWFLDEDPWTSSVPPLTQSAPAG